MTVGSSERMTRKKQARNFPRTISQSDKGFVSKSSRVPPFASSAKLRIVIAGIRKINTYGPSAKSVSISAYPYSNTEVSGKTHIKRPIPVRKTPITTYAINELRKLLNSLDKTWTILEKRK